MGQGLDKRYRSSREEENEETKAGKGKAGKEKKQSTDFKEAVCCPAVVQGQHSERINGSSRGNWYPREGQQPFRPNPNGVGDPTTTLRRLLLRCACFE